MNNLYIITAMDAAGDIVCYKTIAKSAIDALLSPEFADSSGLSVISLVLLQGDIE